MTAAAASLLSAASSQHLSRAASGFVAKAAAGFLVFRIDGFSLTKHLPGGECLTSPAFIVGGRQWYTELYPNGGDGSKDTSDSMLLYLRLYQLPKKARVRAEYKFSLLDAAGKPAYELPAEHGVFRCPGRKPPRLNQPGRFFEPDDEPEYPACGHEEFIRWEELERRRDTLLAGDRLAVRCDVAVVQMEPVHVAPMEQNYVSFRQRRLRVHDYYDEEEEEEEAACTGDNWRSHRQQPMDDDEYVRRCLANNNTRRA